MKHNWLKLLLFLSCWILRAQEHYHFKQAFIGRPSSLHPFSPEGTPYPGLSLAYETLIQAQHMPGAYDHLLAQQLIADTATKDLEIHLNPLARFHNQAPVTTADVINSLQLYQSQYSHPQFQTLFQSLSITPKTTTVFILHYQDSLENTLALLAKMPIVPVNSDPGFKLLPMGSGPYQITHHDSASIHYHRQSYWGAELPHAKERYHFKDISYHHYPSTFHAHLAYMQGHIDYYIETSATRWHGLCQSMPSHTHNLIHSEHQYTQALWLNDHSVVLQDPAVRQMLYELLDLEFLNNWLYHQQYRVNKHPPSPHTHRVHTHHRLEAAGWHLGPDHIRYKNGHALTFSITLWHHHWDAALTHLKQSLDTVGAKLVLNHVSKSIYLKQKRLQQYDLIIEPMVIYANGCYQYDPIAHRTPILHLLEKMSHDASDLSSLHLEKTLIETLVHQQWLIPLFQSNSYRVVIRPNVHVTSEPDPLFWWKDPMPLDSENIS